MAPRERFISLLRRREVRAQPQLVRCSVLDTRGKAGRLTSSGRVDKPQPAAKPKPLLIKHPPVNPKLSNETRTINEFVNLSLAMGPVFNEQAAALDVQPFRT